MDKITENANNLAKELITTADSQSYIQVVNPTTGKVDNMKISDLASVVAGIVPLGSVDMSANDILQTCVCSCYGGVTDIPYSYGILLTFRAGGPYDYAQFFIQRNMPNLYQRTHHYKDGWGDWYKVQ